MKRPITTTTVIALALGTAAVVTPSATANNYGLRGEDGTGVIARGDQGASDLSAGTCEVHATDDAAIRGSQSGFSWVTGEPLIKGSNNSSDNPNKDEWGVAVAFDNSKGRTFSDWYFSNVGNMRESLDLDEVPALDAGKSYLGINEAQWTATDKADENVKITNKGGRGVQRNININAELTDEKVKKLAQATADNPVRYVWQGRYKQEYPSETMRATQGSSVDVGAIVNPWPSENNECNPITTTWDKSENHVITPGEETKVGHINVPALADGSQDDSLSRMVVEAYSTDGKFIGTSDKSAGEDTRLRIDDNGDVFFTWPDYRDPDNGIVANQSVQFSAIALPRSVDQLQQAADANTDGYGKAFESSNALPRYNTPNEIDKHTLSLDDTSLHDPRYEYHNRSFVSGVIDGAPSNERKELVYTQVGDMISDMIDREGEPNNKATVELNTEYVYPGWNAEFVDPDNGNYDVKVTAPANPAPGTFAQPVVEVTYSNGSKDRIEIMAIVDPNHTQQMDLAYEKAPVSTPGQTRTIDAKLTRSIGDSDVIKPKKYELDTSDLPDGWSAEVDQDTGQVTVTPASGAPNGQQFVGKVTATYPDGTTDVAEVNVTAISAIKNADYDTATLYPGNPVEIRPTVADKDASGGTDGPAPSKYTFDGGETTIEQDGITFTIDPETGVITAKADKDLPNGTHVKIPVSLHYPDNPVQTTNVEVISVVAPTRPVPFEVETIFDDTVPAGEARVTREGEQGIEAIQPDGSWKITTEPVNAQVTVGTKPSIATAEQTWTMPIPFDTERRANPDLKPGETRVVQEGKPGERSLTVNVTAQGDNAEIAPEEVTHEPVTEIIEYGPDNNARESVTTTTIPFTTKIIYDPELPEGTNRTEQEGKDGSVTTTATQRVVDGKPQGDPVITEEATDPVEMIVRVGTKQVSTEVSSDIMQPITPTTRVIYDPELAAGEVKEDNPGKDGEKTVTITRTVTGGEAGDPVITEKVTKQPEDRVLRVGTKAAEPGELSWDVPLPYPTEFKENKDLKPGETREVRPGKDGVATFKAEFTAGGTKPVATTEENRTEPTSRIVEYGPRGEETPVVNVIERAVEFDTEVVEDPSLPKGTQVIEQGEFGSERVTITRTVDGGEVDDPVESTERITEPKNAVIRIGTGDVDPVDADVTIPFGTRIVFDPSLEPGQEVEDVPGRDGTSRVTFKDGKASVEVVTQPVERVLRVGAKPAKNTWTERIPFDVEVRENDKLPAGEHTIVREGVAGERVHSGDTVTDTRKPVDMIVEVGTKQPEQPQPEKPEPVVTEVEIPFGTKVVYDPSLKAGEEVEDVAGSTGLTRVTVADGKSTTDEVHPAVDRVIRVGTKPSEKTWTEKVPFEVEVRENSELEQGKHKVVQEGVPGVVEHVDGKSTTVSNAVPMIVEVGTKEPKTTTPEEPKPSDKPSDKPQVPSGSSTTLQRCVANATSANSPFMWLVPLALLGGIGYGVDKTYGPQIANMQRQFNETVRKNTPDLGIGIPEPDWMRQARKQADALAKQFAGAGESLRPVGIAAGAVLAIAGSVGLIHQACQPDGFNAWFGTKDKGSSKE